MLLKTDADAIDPRMHVRSSNAAASSALRLRGRRCCPSCKGGMGVGVSAHKLAGSVAALGGVGTISSVDLRRHHPDLMERTQGLATRPRMDADTKAQIDAANLEAIEREIVAARALAGAACWPST